MEFEEFWKKNYEGEFCDLSPFKDISEYSWEIGQKEIKKFVSNSINEILGKLCSHYMDAEELIKDLSNLRDKME